MKTTAAPANSPTGMLCVIPSRLGVGEPFSVKVKLLGPVHEIPCRGQFNTRKPGLGSPFNLNVERQIQYMDNCLPEWQGELRVDGGDGLKGPETIVFDSVKGHNYYFIVDGFDGAVGGYSIDVSCTKQP